MSFDDKCHDIATWFLADEPDIVSPEAVRRIAQRVQDVIEDEILCIRQDKEAAAVQQ